MKTLRQLVLILIALTFGGSALAQQAASSPAQTQVQAPAQYTCPAGYTLVTKTVTCEPVRPQPVARPTAPRVTPPPSPSAMPQNLTVKNEVTVKVERGEGGGGMSPEMMALFVKMMSQMPTDNGGGNAALITAIQQNTALQERLLQEAVSQSKSARVANKWLGLSGIANTVTAGASVGSFIRLGQMNESMNKQAGAVDDAIKVANAHPTSINMINKMATSVKGVSSSNSEAQGGQGGGGGSASAVSVSDSSGAGAGAGGGNTTTNNNDSSASNKNSNKNKGGDNTNNGGDTDVDVDNTATGGKGGTGNGGTGNGGEGGKGGKGGGCTGGGSCTGTGTGGTGTGTGGTGTGGKGGTGNGGEGGGCTGGSCTGTGNGGEGGKGGTGNGGTATNNPPANPGHGKPGHKHDSSCKG